MEYHLAQMNVTTLVDLPGHESNAEFLPVLEAVNAIAEISSGFVGRLKDESGQSSALITSDGDPRFVINMSVWKSVEALTHYAHRSGHASYLPTACRAPSCDGSRKEQPQPSNTASPASNPHAQAIPSGPLPHQRRQSPASGGTLVANLSGHRFPHLPCSDAFAARGDVGGSESGLQHGLDGVFDRSCLFLEFQ